MVRQDRFISAQALMARMRAGQKIINYWLLSLGCRTYKPTRKPLLTANHRRLCLEWAQRWQNLTMTHWKHVIFRYESRFQLYLVDGRLRVCRSLGEHFQQGCEAYRHQADGGLVHIWGAFHSGARSPPVLPNRCVNAELYRGILQNTLVPFARQLFGGNYRY